MLPASAVRQDITATLATEKVFLCQQCGTWTPWSAGGDNCLPEEKCRYCNPAAGEEQPPCGLICAECWCARHPSFAGQKPAFDLPPMDRVNLSFSIGALAGYYRDNPVIARFAERALSRLGGKAVAQ